jgi:ribosomal protein S24E
MKMEAKERKKNAPMKREEVMFSVNHEGKATPSRADLLKEVASKLKVKDELLIIDKIFSTSGKSESEVTVLVYKKKDDIPKGKLEKMKRRMEKKKKKPAEEPKPAEKPAEGEAKECEVKEGEEKAEEAKPSEEKPAEVKEEAKEEEKAVEKTGEKTEEKKEEKKE